MRRWIAALTAALAVGMLFGGDAWAQATPAAAPFGQASLIGGGWKLKTMVSADKTVYGPVRQVFYTIRLTADGKVELTADCNSGGGTYTLTGDKLTISPLITTLVGCPEGSVGSQFAQMLSGEHTVSWQGDKLILTAADGASITL
jgi:heat shock protein HslJ